MPRVDTRFPVIKERRRREILTALSKVYEAQRGDVLARYESGSAVLLSKRWDDELYRAIFDNSRAAAREIGAIVAHALNAGPDEWDPDVMDPWLDEAARGSSRRINDHTRGQLDDAGDRDAVSGVFAVLLSSGVDRQSRGVVTETANFAVNDAAKASGDLNKRWQVNSGNPRSSHAALNGQIVPIDGVFSNGMRWPGDGANGGAGDVANCRCSLTIL